MEVNVGTLEPNLSCASWRQTPARRSDIANTCRYTEHLL